MSNTRRNKKKTVIIIFFQSVGLGLGSVNQVWKRPKPDIGASASFGGDEKPINWLKTK